MGRSPPRNGNQRRREDRFQSSSGAAASPLGRLQGRCRDQPGVSDEEDLSDDDDWLEDHRAYKECTGSRRDEIARMCAPGGTILSVPQESEERAFFVALSDEDELLARHPELFQHKAAAASAFESYRRVLAQTQTDVLNSMRVPPASVIIPVKPLIGSNAQPPAFHTDFCMQHGPGPPTHESESASRNGALARDAVHHKPRAGGLSNVSDEAELSDDDAWHGDRNSNIFASDAHL